MQCVKLYLKRQITWEILKMVNLRGEKKTPMYYKILHILLFTDKIELQKQFSQTICIEN